MALALAVDIGGGAVRLSLRNRALGSGIRAASVEIEVLELQFPLDLAGGAGRFQSHPTRLTRAAIELDLAELSGALRDAAAARGLPISDLSLRPDRGTLQVEGHAGSVPLSASLAVAPDRALGLRLVLDDERRYGVARLGDLHLIEILRDAIEALLANLPGASAAVLQPPSTITLDPIAPLLWSLFPPNGWRVPQHHSPFPLRVRITRDRIEIVAGDHDDETGGDEPEAVQRALRILARADMARAFAPELWLSRDPGPAFVELRSRIDARGGPPVLVDRLLLLGSTRPSLHADTADLAADALARNPACIQAHLARGAIAAHEGKGDEAAAAFELAAGLLDSEGSPRAAAFALLAASRAAADLDLRLELLGRAARHAADAPAILPDTIDALSRTGRTHDAIQAARRLARSTEAPVEQRARAFVQAGDLLLDREADPSAAKREYERALLLQPGRDDALEGLGRAVVARGDPRRSAAILEEMIGRAETAGDPGRAARLSIALGDLWRAREPEAAFLRYRRARELDPDDVSALDRVARVGSELGADEAVDAARALIRAARSGARIAAPDLAAYQAIAGEAPSTAQSELRSALAITAKNEDWAAHGACLRGLIDLTEDPAARADLHTRLGEVLEWKLGDGDAAERAYLAARAADPSHEKSRDALTSIYVAADRFGDLADNVGLDVLRSMWAELKRSGPPNRTVAAAEALWPRLPEGSAERAEVILALADLYRTVRDEAEGAVLLLEQVVRNAPRRHQDAALERLRVLFLEEGRHDLYAEVVRRQTARSEQLE